MKLRLVERGREYHEFEAPSVEDLAHYLEHVARSKEQTAEALAGMHLHLWHSDTWWDLTKDLSPFTSWLMDVIDAEPEDVRRFMEHPFEYPDWLFLAAVQMKRLLDAATG